MLWLFDWVWDVTVEKYEKLLVKKIWLRRTTIITVFDPQTSRVKNSFNKIDKKNNLNIIKQTWTIHGEIDWNAPLDHSIQGDTRKFLCMFCPFLSHIFNYSFVHVLIGIVPLMFIQNVPLQLYRNITREVPLRQYFIHFWSFNDNTSIILLRKYLQLYIYMPYVCITTMIYYTTFIMQCVNNIIIPFQHYLLQTLWCSWNNNNNTYFIMWTKVGSVRDVR